MNFFELKNQSDFELAHIFECGQCFRWNKNDDGSYVSLTDQEMEEQLAKATELMERAKSGEKMEDLRPFDSHDFARALLSRENS